ncbi:hypothetical protein [Exiguobacterium sp. s142]|uniref:hypothetical protein n=1 Tax=Exiguobacterium sp. s142 TaxID=2751222 RepID=UPI001BE4FB51|nr:hypothetical protein [Exiguobacterium sp. s142]
MKDNNRKLKILYTFFICILPLIHHYSSPLPNITLGEIGLLAFTGLALVKFFVSQSKFNEPLYLMFVCSMIFVSLLTVFFQYPSYNFSAVASLFMRLFFYLVLITITARYYFDAKMAIKIYMTIAIGVSSYLYVQIFSFYVLGQVAPSVTSLIPLYNNPAYEMINFERVYAHLFRPQSIFLEPGVFAQYLFPAVILSLFKFGSQTDSINYKRAVFFSITLVATLSAQAMFITILIWLIWLTSQLKTMNVRKVTLISSSLIVFLITFSILITTNESFHKATIGRFIEGTTYDSTEVRVYRGFQVYNELDPLFKVIGVGFGNITEFVTSNNITTESDLYGVTSTGEKQYNYEYMNSIAYILVTGGILSFVIFVLFLSSIFKKSKDFSFVALIVLIIMCFYGGILISPTWIIFMTFIFGEIKLRESELLRA